MNNNSLMALWAGNLTDWRVKPFSAGPGSHQRSSNPIERQQYERDMNMSDTIFPDIDIKPAEERLCTIARDVLRTHRTYPEQRDTLFSEVYGDAPLLWAMFRNWAPDAARYWLQRAEDELRSEAKRANRSHSSADDHYGTAPFAREGASGQNFHDDHAGSAHSSTSDPPPHDRDSPASAAALVDARENIRRASMLDFFTVNNRPIGDCTAKEVRAWLSSKQKQYRFAELLIVGLPDRYPIRKFIHPWEADELWARVQAGG